jgi:hypothetical protein
MLAAYGKSGDSHLFRGQALHQASDLQSETGHCHRFFRNVLAAS